MDRPIFCDDMDETDPYFYVLVAIVTSIVIVACVCAGCCYIILCRDQCETRRQMPQAGTSRNGQRQLTHPQVPTSDTNEYTVRVVGNRENTHFAQAANDDPPPSYEECMQKPPAYHFDGSGCVVHSGSSSDETKGNNETLQL